jgi:hypothetical protein
MVSPIIVSHMGGDTAINRAGDLTLRGRGSTATAELSEVLGVEHYELSAGVIALLGMGEIRRLGMSLDFIARNPGCSWELAVRPARTSRPSLWQRVVSCFRRRPAEPLPELVTTPLGLAPNPRHPGPGLGCANGTNIDDEEQSPLLVDREPWSGPLAPSAARLLFESEEEQCTCQKYARLLQELKERDGNLLLFQTKARIREDLRRRTAEKMDYLRSRSEKRRPAASPGQSSSMASPVVIPKAERRRILMDIQNRAKALKFYAVRRGHVPGVYYTWPECEANVKGVSNEYKSFKTYEAAVEWYNIGRPAPSPRLECWTTELRGIPSTSFVSGTGLRALADVYQDGHQQTTSVVCGLDSMSDVTLALEEFLHDVHDIETESLSTTGSSATFDREGTLKLLVNSEIIEIPSLVATAAQLPRICGILLDVPGLDALGVQLDEHRKRLRIPLVCHVGKKTLRAWWETREGKSVEDIVHDIETVDVCPDLTPQTRARVRTLLSRYEHVFEGRQTTLPKPFAAEPIELKFVEDPIPQAVPEPR